MLLLPAEGWAIQPVGRRPQTIGAMGLHQVFGQGLAAWGRSTEPSRAKGVTNGGDHAARIGAVLAAMALKSTPPATLSGLGEAAWRLGWRQQLGDLDRR